MNIIKTLKNRAVSGLLAMSLTTSLMAAFVIAATTQQPTIHIDGLELRIVSDYETNASGQYINADKQPLAAGESPIPKTESGQPAQSIQALVSISVSNVERCTGLLLPLWYNSEYLVPSDWKTNGEITKVDTDALVDNDDRLHHLLFRADEALYEGDDPFAWGSQTAYPSTLTLDTGTDSGIVSLQLSLISPADPRQKPVEKGLLKAHEYGNGRADIYYDCIIDNEKVKDGKVALGSVSFRVVNAGNTFQELQTSLQKLAEMFDKSTTGKSEDGNTTLFSTVTKSQLSTSDTKTDYITLWQIKQNAITPNGRREPVDENLTYSIHIDSDNVVVDANPVSKERTINSYEAYTDGQVSDLALAMQKYAESIRVTYAKGNMEDRAIYWGEKTTNCVNMPDESAGSGEGPGMFIRKQGSDDIYRFTWDSTEATGYKFEKWDSGQNKYVAADPINDFSYDPKGNQTYLISQYFTYTELDGVPPEEGEPDNRTTVLKAYPVPVEVKLTVNPVKLTGASVDHETLSYRNVVYNENTAPDGVPEHYSALGLAEAAKLAIDTGLDGVVPTLPVTWTPATLKVDDTTGISGSGTAKWPVTVTDYENKTGVGSYGFTADITESAIRNAYPWLTTAGTYYTFTSTRRIVDEGTADAALLSGRYELTVEPFEENNGEEIGRLRVTIAKKAADGSYTDMPTNSTFRLYLPDGTLVNSGWFGANNSSYTESRLMVDGMADSKMVYRIVISPGNVGANGTYQTQLETVRRYINLGGWFSLRVHESTMATDVWSDVLTDYSEPRTNTYIKSYTAASDTEVSASVEKLFDYTGNNAGLMPFYTGNSLPTFVTLPADDSVAIRYDAFSGTQPGALRQFAVGTWDHVATGSADGVTTRTYGADYFSRLYTYSENGLVVNPDTGSYTGYLDTVRNRQVIVKVQEQGTADTADKKLRLTYDQTGDSVTNTGDGEVERVTFNTKQVGYTYQQIVTLTLTNKGTTEIRGIHVDIPTNAFTTGVSGPYFDLITAPAVNLPAGASTTFQVSYVPNLPVGTYENITATHRIDIYDETNSKLKDFEAVIKITEGQLHAVSIVVHPGEQEDVAREMGDAFLVTGIVGGAYSSNAAPTTYEEGQTFWILTAPVDEYKLLTTGGKVQVYYEDQNKEKVYLTEYVDTAVTAVNGGKGFLGGNDTTKDQGRGIQRLFWHAMPDYSVTVHVHYYEDLYSKLRITDLHAYAWSNAVKTWDDKELPPDEGNNSVWIAAYEKELRESKGDNYAAVDGSVVKFDSQKDEYIVVLAPQGSGDDWCGVEITLRDVKVRINGVGDWSTNGTAAENNVGDWSQMGISYYAGTNQYLPVGDANKLNVVMRVDDGYNTAVGGNPPTGETNGGTNKDEPSVHKSISFAMPTDNNDQYMATRTVTITVQYRGADLRPVEEGDETGLVQRVYKVRFVRRAAEGAAKHTANAGNSPYGMIENDKTISDKAAAREQFDKDNRFTATNRPVKANVDGNQLTNIYWPEAWGDGTNYDRDAAALFVYLGQNFYEPGVRNIYNSAGDLLPDDTVVTLSLDKYYVMASGSAYDRFHVNAETTDKPIPLGTAMVKDGAIAGQEIAFATAKYTVEGDDTATVKATDIRPGVYALTYTFPDYNSTKDTPKTISFTRPLIVLSPIADVNADLSVNATDANTLWTRFGTVQLPLELGDGIYSAQDKLLYRYRIADADNDRNINDVDADLIRRDIKDTNTALAPFYRPIDYINN